MNHVVSRPYCFSPAAPSLSAILGVSTSSTHTAAVAIDADAALANAAALVNAAMFGSASSLITSSSAAVPHGEAVAPPPHSLREAAMSRLGTPSSLSSTSSSTSTFQLGACFAFFLRSPSRLLMSLSMSFRHRFVCLATSFFSLLCFSFFRSPNLSGRDAVRCCGML